MLRIPDVTGVELIPGNQGEDCPGNGKHVDQNGEILECCCDECDYLLCCLEPLSPEACGTCSDPLCPHAGKTKP